MFDHRTLCAAAACAVALFALATEARAEGTMLHVENKTGDHITVNVDGTYGCNTSAGSTCTIPVEVGNRELTATRSDTGATTSTTLECGSDGCTWVPWSE